jgi:hypothetical protein
MNSLVAVWTLYLSSIGAIYKIATKLPEFLSPHLFRDAADGIQNYDVSNNLISINRSIKLFVDKAFRFRSIGKGIFLPSLKRSAVVSAFLFLFFSVPALLLSKGSGLLSGMENPGVLFLILWIPAFLSDYLSFVKSRYLIERAYNANTVLGTLVIAALDILASVAIVYVILTLFGIAVFGAASTDDDWMTGLIRDALTDIVLFALTISATAVTFCSVIISIIHVLYFQLQKVEAVRSGLFRTLNFEEKPHIAIAVIVIAGFTIVYWPIAIPIALAR